MNTLPDSAQCRSLLADGSTLVVTATRRPRANRADVKCSVAGAPALAERMLQVLRLARHTEPRFDSRDQVVVSVDGAPGAHDGRGELRQIAGGRDLLWVRQTVGVG